MRIKVTINLNSQEVTFQFIPHTFCHIIFTTFSSYFALLWEVLWTKGFYDISLKGNKSSRKHIFFFECMFTQGLDCVGSVSYIIMDWQKKSCDNTFFPTTNNNSLIFISVLIVMTFRIQFHIQCREWENYKTRVAKTKTRRRIICGLIMLIEKSSQRNPLHIQYHLSLCYQANNHQEIEIALPNNYKHSLQTFRLILILSNSI